jgi:signal transduction histidine kinase
MIKTVFKMVCLLIVVSILPLARAHASSPVAVKADTAAISQHPVLIVTSYNPDTRTMAENLAAFLEVYRQHEYENPISVESMNCKNLSEAPEWKRRMADILSKYSEPDKQPALVVLLGQEACGAYLAQDSHLAQTTPSIFGLGSAYTVALPTDSDELATWQPACLDVTTDFPQFNIVGGYLYAYDIDTNLQLIRHYYPERHHYLFLSDNTFGGIIMHAYAQREFERLLGKDETVEWLDGRLLSITDVASGLRAEGEDAAVLIGTWRIDCTENYVMGNITHLLREANTGLPAFTVSSVGINDWALGGYTPVYQVVGDKIATLALDFLKDHRRPEGRPIVCLPSHYVFDYNRLQEFGIDESELPAGAEVVNRPLSFIQEHYALVTTVLFIIVVLALSFGIAVFYLVRIRRMNVRLEEMSRDLIVAKDRAEEANRLKTSFLANMSHEIRTPLNAIVGFSGVLAHEDITDQERLQFCEIIRINSDLLLHLINDILDLSRIESGRMQFTSEDVEVVELCKTSLATSEYARRTKASFVFSSRLSRLRLRTDGQRLQQVLINLLSNAAKFTQQGFINLKLEANRERGEAIFTVEDTGCGIPPEKAEKVFERFEKLNEYAQGTGLGLAISRVIVEKLGGRIWLDTSYTQGARFVFTLPMGENDIVRED